MLSFLLRASWAVACQVLAATLAFVQQRLHPLLCGVNSRGAIIAGNHLHTLLRSERRAKHLLQLALRPPGWPTCKHTLLCVAEGRHPPSGRGDPITWAPIGSEGKCRQWLAHTSVPRRQTDARFSQLTLLAIHMYTLTCRAQAYLWACSVNLKVPAGPQCVDLCAHICLCREVLCYIWMSKTECMWSSEDKIDKNWAEHKRSTFSLLSLIRPANVGLQGRTHAKKRAEGQRESTPGSSDRIKRDVRSRESGFHIGVDSWICREAKEYEEPFTFYSRTKKVLMHNASAVNFQLKAGIQ